jgi:membrane protein YdbS with pleckstrin-like domain
MTDTGAAHPGTTDAGAAYPGTTDAGATDAGAAQPEKAALPGTTDTETAHPGTIDAGAARPIAGEAGSAHPDAEPSAGIPPGLRAPRNQVSRRTPWYWTTTAIVEAVLLVGGLTAVAALCGLGSAWWTAIGSVGALLLLRAAVMPRWRYRVHRWEVTGDALYTRTGWFSVRWGIAPISRIQTIDSERRLPERIFGLANVTATTASAAGHIKIRGLDLATADRLLSDLSLATASIPGDAT